MFAQGDRVRRHEGSEKTARFGAAIGLGAVNVSLALAQRFHYRLSSHPDWSIGPMSTPSRTRESSARRILIIDDNRDVADSLAMLLSTFGADVRVAYGGEEGLERFREFLPQLVLLDLGMPRVDGYETARRLRALPEGRAVKLVALSGWGQEQSRGRVQDAGFDGQLTKPAGFEDLRSLLDSLQ